MRIAYVLHLDVGRESGVIKKIRGQVANWRLQGEDVKMFALSPTTSVWSGLDDLPTCVVGCQRMRHRFLAWRALAREVISWQPDVCYLRYDLYNPWLERLMAKIPTALEINSDDVAEYRLTMPPVLFTYNLLTRNRTVGKARGLIFVTHEIAARHARFEAPRIVIANGIDLDNYSPVAQPGNKNSRLVFLGSSAPWHGIDKVITLARRFPNWRFDLVGVTGTVSGGKLPPNVKAHGLLPGAEYNEVMSQANAAIGPLALHRKKMVEASSLKVREYLAYGIPTIIGGADADFPQGAWFLLQLANTESNVSESLDDIQRFVEKRGGARVPRSEIAHLDSKVKESVRLKFLYELLAK